MEDEVTVQQVVFILLVITAAACAVAVLSWALIRAGRLPPPSMLVLSVSILSLTALLGGLIFNSDSSLALAGAGIGALAGAVSSTFTNPRRHEERRDDE